MVESKALDKGCTAAVGIGFAFMATEGETRKPVLEEIPDSELTNKAGILVGSTKKGRGGMLEHVDDGLTRLLENPGLVRIGYAGNETVEMLNTLAMFNVIPFE